MATFYKETCVDVDVDIDLSPREIYECLGEGELIELSRLISDSELTDKDYTLSNMIISKSDDQILEDKNFLDMLIKLIKYDNSVNLDYVIEELSYGRS